MMEDLDLVMRLNTQADRARCPSQPVDAAGAAGCAGVAWRNAGDRAGAGEDPVLLAVPTERRRSAGVPERTTMLLRFQLPTLTLVEAHHTRISEETDALRSHVPQSIEQIHHHLAPQTGALI